MTVIWLPVSAEALLSGVKAAIVPNRIATASRLLLIVMEGLLFDLRKSWQQLRRVPRTRLAIRGLINGNSMATHRCRSSLISDLGLTRTRTVGTQPQFRPPGRGFCMTASVRDSHA